MCGIIGYTGVQAAVPVIMQGLERLEYRGYDSAGMGIFENGQISLYKTVGSPSRLREKAPLQSEAKTGIGHTRWATHGAPDEKNAHPHLSENGKLQIDGKPIDIIYSHNDSMTLGFLDVFDAYGINSGKDVTIVSIDAEQAAIDALKAGKINCVVECNPKLGPIVMNLVKALYNHEKIPSITRISEIDFTEFDDLSELNPRGY